jgi:hypothetical protein
LWPASRAVSSYIDAFPSAGQEVVDLVLQSDQIVVVVDSEVEGKRVECRLCGMIVIDGGVKCLTALL